MTSSVGNGCHLKLYRDGSRLLVGLHGALRLSNCEAVKSVLIPLFDTAPEVLYISLGQLTELDSAGLGVLVGLHMTARSRKVALKVLSPTAFVARLFETTKLNAVLTIIQGIEAEAIRAALEQDTLAVSTEPSPSI